MGTHMNTPSDRSKRMKALFGGIDPSSLEQAPSPAPTEQEKRVGAGAIKSVQGAFSAIEQENDKLRVALAQGERLVDLDPDLIEASFVRDRMDFENDAEFQSLVDSIRETGQQVPVLVRPHPAHSGRYQLAYGHRRWRAAKTLLMPVKALIRQLSDDALVIAQGKENTERKSLSFIEQAMFAQTLKDRGFDRQTIANALGRGEKKGLAYISMLTAVTGALPASLIHAIGPAPSSGRPRWEQLVARYAELPSERSFDAMIASEAWKALESDQRLLKAISFFSAPTKKRESLTDSIANAKGQACITVQRSGSHIRIALDNRKSHGFADWLVGQLPEMLKKFERETENDD
ncbi:plasmid partitioning protein RepB [Limoniibacter endophyticus]|uniref:Plasmid partitioning protein RepB n=1 Tax=Limoniibacter endophyticus TaxID=1565040 RepID=A0A8J3DJB4_9HYPH|nr:plasmid partitioning protein RepB [Limoniibacter endophyticus]GHC77567.1 plasmid partitioning protein RepB [Limoniibacter endophyticus]